MATNVKVLKPTQKKEVTEAVHFFTSVGLIVEMGLQVNDGYDEDDDPVSFQENVVSQARVLIERIRELESMVPTQ